MEMDKELEQKLEDGRMGCAQSFSNGEKQIWFSSANMSFYHEGRMNVSASGTCFAL